MPDISHDQFQKIAEGAKAGCPVSKALNAEIALDWKLAQSLGAAIETGIA